MIGKKCAVIGGAEVSDSERAEILSCRYIICADGGYDTALRLRIQPDVLIGDFDTVSALPSGDSCEVIRYLPEKDDTDTMLAVKLAIQLGFEDITVFGGIGGRLDHTFANIQTLEYIHSCGCKGTLFSDCERVFLQNEDRAEYTREDGMYFSIFSLSERSEGIYLTGFKYPLVNAVFERSFPLGVSNEITGKVGVVEKSSGLLLIIRSKMR